jgi:hypothetical protein
LNIKEIRPFFPSKDYDLSKSFYESLGFKGESAGPDLTIFQQSDCTFFLQRYYNEDFANNLMLQLIVENIDEAYELVSGLNKVKHSEIKRESWGSVVYLWGPSGELWHITELGS